MFRKIGVTMRHVYVARIGVYKIRLGVPSREGRRDQRDRIPLRKQEFLLGTRVYRARTRGNFYIVFSLGK